MSRTLTLGILWSLAAVALFAASGAMVKLLGRNYGPSGVAFLRGGIGFVALAPLAIGLARVRSLRQPRLYALRCGLGLLALMGLVASFVYLPLAVAMTLFLSRVPLFAGIGMVLWREPTGWRIWVPLVVGLAGVALLIEPRLDGLVAVGVGAALVASIASSGSQTAVKAIARTEPPISIVFWFSAFTTLALMPFNLDVVETIDGHDLIVAVAMAVTAVLAQWTTANCYRHLTNAAAGAIDYLTIPVSAVVDWAMFGRAPTSMDVVGATLVVGSAITLHRHNLRASA